MARVVLVTGAAKRIGAGIARALAAAGHRVVIHYGRSEVDARALAAEIDAVGVVGADLADTDVVAGLIEHARAVAGAPIDGLVNSASEFAFDRPEQVDPALAARLYSVNCVAPAMLAGALAAQADLAEGAVVNLLDQKLANPNPDFFSYSCAKYALAGATTMLAQALAPRVRVNAVAPGLTLPSGDQDAAEFEQVARANLLGRAVGVEAVADAVAWLLAADRVTGQTIFVDSGQRFCRRGGDVMFEGRTEPAHG